MTVNETLSQLKTLANKGMYAQNLKNGVGDNQFGVRLGEIENLAKKMKSNHGLCLSLWQTDILDARLLAILLVKPKKLTADELDEMVHSIRFLQVADWFNEYIVKNHVHRETLRKKWMNSEHPMAARSGWNLTSIRVVEKPKKFNLSAILDRLESEMGQASKEVQWTMNLTLVEIGVKHPKYRERAIAIGEALGIYSDYPIDREGSPFAPIRIKEMVSRQVKNNRKARR